MDENIFDIYDSIEEIIELPTEIDDINTYKEELLGVLEEVGITIADRLIVDSLCNFHKRRIDSTIICAYEVPQVTAVSQHNVEQLQQQQEQNPKWMTDTLTRESVEQRSEDWYKQAANMVTASEFCNILKPGRTRGRIVLSKVNL